jgi:hypothetical protein
VFVTGFVGSAQTPTRGLETPTKSAAASPVSDTKHTVHRPTILRSASLLELKPHVAAQSDPVRVALMGQFRTRTVSTSRLDVDSSPETQAYTMPHDKVVEDLCEPPPPALSSVYERRVADA